MTSVKVPIPSHYSYYNRNSSELGIDYQPNYIAGADYYGPNYKVCMVPPGL